MRAALYARFSSDLQNPASIDDQFRTCRRHAERIGAEVVAEFSDAGISGASAVNRPGLQALLAAARAGRFDVVVVEALDRLSRSLADVAAIHEDLKADRVAINTIAEGEAQTLQIAFKGGMNAMFLEELGRKTRRGLEGVARAGRVAALAYGYRIERRIGPRGEVTKGLRAVDQDQAEVVRRIFSDYAAGISPEQIAATLNADGTPAFRGGLWNAHTIRGNRARGVGILNNDLYRGVLVWGRSSSVKDRRTGRTKASLVTLAGEVQVAAPDLRIVSDDLWASVAARKAAIAAVARPEQARRPRRLLSGLVKCGVCGGTMTVSSFDHRRDRPDARPTSRYVCGARHRFGPAVCSGQRTPEATRLEARVLDALKAALLQPALVEHWVRERHLAQARQARETGQHRAGLERELAEARRRAERLVDQVEQGMPWTAIAERHRALSDRAETLQRQLDAADSPQVVQLHPRAAERYRELVENLQSALTEGEATASRATARELLRAIIGTVSVYPEAQPGQYRAEIDGDLGPMLAGAGTGERASPPSKARSASASAAGPSSPGEERSTRWVCGARTSVPDPLAQPPRLPFRLTA